MATIHAAARVLGTGDGRRWVAVDVEGRPGDRYKPTIPIGVARQMLAELGKLGEERLADGEAAVPLSIPCIVTGKPYTPSLPVEVARLVLAELTRLDEAGALTESDAG